MGGVLSVYMKEMAKRNIERSLSTEGIRGAEKIDGRKKIMNQHCIRIGAWIGVFVAGRRTKSNIATADSLSDGKVPSRGTNCSRTYLENKASLPHTQMEATQIHPSCSGV